MPPPPLPLDPSNGRFPHTQEVFDLQLREASCSNWSPGFNDPQADVIEVEESTATNHHVPEPEYRFMSDEEIATSTKSEEAMKEIHRICEPFLGPDLNLRSPPPMDLSAAVIKEMGLDFKSQKQAAGEVRGKGKQDARPNPVQIRPNMAPEATPMPPNNQGTKRKEYDDDNEDFQHVQLDVEKQGSRPRKQVKLVHHANFQNGNGALYHNAAYNSQHQQYFAPRPGGLQSGYGYGQGFGGPTVQGARPHWGASVEDANTYNGGGPFEEQDGGIIGQQLNQTIEPFHSQSHPATHSGKAFSNRQSSVGSPYIPVSTARAQPSDFQPLSFQPGGPSEKSYYGNIQASQTLKGPPTISPAMPNAQPPSRQSPGTQFEPRADGRNNRGPLRQTSKNHRYNPYASSSKGNGQSMEIPQMHQPDGRDQLQTAWTPVAQAEEPYNPETIPSSSDNNPSPNGVPAFPQFLDLDNIFEYINDDPGQGIDLERTQKARDWILTV